MLRTPFSILAFCLCAALAVTPAAATQFSFINLFGPQMNPYVGGSGPAPVLLPDRTTGTGLLWQSVQVQADPSTGIVDFTGVFQCAGTVACTGPYFQFAYMAIGLPTPALISLSMNGIATGAFSGSFSATGSFGAGNVSLGAVSVSNATGYFNVSSGITVTPSWANNMYYGTGLFQIDSMAPGGYLNLGVTSAEIRFGAAPEPVTFSVLGGGLGLLALYLRRRKV